MFFIWGRLNLRETLRESPEFWLNLTYYGKIWGENNSRQNVNNNLPNQKLHAESKPPPHTRNIMWLLKGILTLKENAPL